MPGWLIRVLKWGGLALFGVNALALILVMVSGPPSQDAAPAGGYLTMALFGLVAWIAGLVADRYSRLP